LVASGKFACLEDGTHYRQNDPVGLRHGGSSMSRDGELERALSGVDEAKRKTLARLVTGAAFVAPVVVSFPIDGLTISAARAQCSNCTTSAKTFSDRRLKKGIARVATHQSSGLGLYRFKYLWSATEYVGVMAQEVREIMPNAVVEGDDGFLRVDYRALGIEMLTYATWRERNVATAAA
jgi:hypothetical protein